MKSFIVWCATAVLLASACAPQSATTAPRDSAASNDATAPGLLPGPGAVSATSAPTPAAAAASASPTPAATTSAPAATPAPASTAPASTSAPAATPTSAPPTSAPPSAPPAAATTILVTLTDTAVKLNQTSAPAGSVTFVVTNAGDVVHELVVLQTTIPQDQLPAATAYTVQEPGSVGKLANLAAGAKGTLTLTLAPGSYVLICNLALHYQQGMHTAFTVK